MDKENQGYCWRTYRVDTSFYCEFLDIDGHELEMLSGMLCNAGGRDGESQLPVLIRKFPRQEWPRTLEEIETIRTREPRVYLDVSDRHVASLALSWCRGFEKFPLQMQSLKGLQELYLTNIGLESIDILKANCPNLKRLYLGASELMSLKKSKQKIIASLYGLDVTFGENISEAWLEGTRGNEIEIKPDVWERARALLSGVFGTLG